MSAKAVLKNVNKYDAKGIVYACPNCKVYQPQSHGITKCYMCGQLIDHDKEQLFDGDVCDPNGEIIYPGNAVVGLLDNLKILTKCRVLPCPICQKSKVTCRKHIDINSSDVAFSMACTYCHYHGAVCKTEQQAADAWNADAAEVSKGAALF